MGNYITKYKNGNYWVKIYEDGTKIRYTKENDFQPERPESIDLSISNRCTGGCPFCYMNATPDGPEADLAQPFFSTIKPGTEIAINLNGGADLEKIKAFLKKMHEQEAIVNITVSSKHLFTDHALLDRLDYWHCMHYFYGLGVSYDPMYVTRAGLKDLWYCFDENFVLHCIVGLFGLQHLESITTQDSITDTPIKLLFLGFKKKGRASNADLDSIFFNNAVNDTKSVINMIKNKDINISKVAFDNLALKQLGISKETLGERDWDRYFLGDDGTFTFYIDAVNKRYAVSSTSEEYFPIKPDDTIETMFKNIRNKVTQV